MENYENKYKKYKNKYVKLKKNEMSGGFSITDTTPGTMLNTVIGMLGNNQLFLNCAENILSHSQDRYVPNMGIARGTMINLNINNCHQSALQCDLIYAGIENDKIYDYLIKMYCDKKKYTQVFKRLGLDGKIFNDPPHQPKELEMYHVNYAALIYLDILLEYESFLMTYSSNNYNAATNNYHFGGSYVTTFDRSKNYKRNNYIKLFYDGEPRMYRNYLFNNSNKPIDIFVHVCEDIEKYFNEVMEKLVSNLVYRLNFCIGAQVLDYYDVLGCIICVDNIKILVNNPMNNMTGNPKMPFVIDQNKKFNHIYHNWKDRLASLARSKMPPHNSHLHISDFQAEIFTCIANTIGTLENPTENRKYISECAGFFSYSYLLLNSDDAQRANYRYGSCVTSTLIELFILSRLHIQEDNFYVAPQYQKKTLSNGIITIHNDYHKYLFHTQNIDYYILNNTTNPPIKRNYGASHWATLLKTSDELAMVLTRKGYKNHIIFRDIIENNPCGIDCAFQQPFIGKSRDPINFFKILIYPTIDTHVSYANINNIYNPLYVNLYENNPNPASKYNYVSYRISFFDRLLKHYVRLSQIHHPRQPP